MGKVFLSHSSKDKDFVRPIADLFGKDRCYYDEYTFEAGMKNIDEILRCLDKSDIFVIFISDSSLDSDWVKEELANAYSNLKISSHVLGQIFPIIIDKSVTHSDPRIPNYLKKGFDSYNLRYIKNYKLAYKKISAQLIRHQMELDSNFKERKNYYYGRGKEILNFRERYDDSTKNSVKCIIASGVEGIGRRSYIRESLLNAKLIESYYFPSVIVINRLETIDDLIIKISELGFDDYSIEVMSSIHNIDEKIQILAELFKEMQNNNEYLIIYDEKCIIGENQNVKYWFEKAIKDIRNEFVVAIATNIRLDPLKYKNNEDIFSISLVELTTTERAGLLRTYSKLEDIEFEREDIAYLQGSLTGYPPQVEFCVDLAKEKSIEYVKKNPHLIVDYSSDKAVQILNSVIGEGAELEYQLLSFLSIFDTVPIKIINDIYELNSEYASILQKFMKYTICRYVGSSTEYLKVNSVIQDYIQRNKFELPQDIKEYLENSIKEFNDNIMNDEYTNYMDFSEISVYIRENLKQGSTKLPDKFLYSTVFLRSIVELYNAKKVKRVVNIVKEIKENGTFEMYDIATQDQIQYYYCQALVLDNNNEFKSEVEYFLNSRNNNYNYLKGFYERKNGDFTKAEKLYNQVLQNNPKHKKAKRELVLVYRMLDDYEAAFELARDNYYSDRDNIYQIQAYFDCLIKKEELSDTDKNDIEIIPRFYVQSTHITL